MWSQPTTVWSAKAVDDTFNTIKGTLNCENGRLTFVLTPFNATFSLDENNEVKWQDADLYKVLTLDVTSRRDDIIEEYIGKDILIGWHGEDYEISDDGIPLDITFQRNKDGKIVLEGDYDYEEIKVVDPTGNMKTTEKISVLPRLDKLHFFTVTENSILKRKTQ